MRSSAGSIADSGVGIVRSGQADIAVGLGLHEMCLMLAASLAAPKAGRAPMA